MAVAIDLRARLISRPVQAALVGAFCIAFSGILFDLANVSASTGAFFRCLWALPFLLPLAFIEDRRFGSRPLRGRLLAGIAGLFFAADLILWHRAIHEVGAGLSTVLGNLQVVFVGPLAWVLLAERLRRRSIAAIPIALGGVVLISGVLEQHAFGRRPGVGVAFGLGSALGYTGFLLCLRQSGADVRRLAGPLSDSTLVCAVACAVAGAAIGDLDLAPPLHAQLWLVLLGVTSQVIGWLFIALSLPRLPAALTSVLLTLQPLLSILFAAMILSERPSPLQLAGASGVLAALLLATATPGATRRPADMPVGPAT
jgi:drug/metabolite transporter (DMT)-like permease